MKLGRPAVVAISRYKELKFQDPNARVSTGYLVGAAYKEIQEDIPNIDWVKLNSAFIPGVTGNDESIGPLQTALTMDAGVLERIEELQRDLMAEFGTKRMFKPFVIKLILFAAILKENNTLILKEEKKNEFQQERFGRCL